MPVLDRKGQIRHDGGVVDDRPGLYLLGMPFLRRRKSSFIDGAGDDADDLSAHLTAYLEQNAFGRAAGARIRPARRDLLRRPGFSGQHHSRPMSSVCTTPT